MNTEAIGSRTEHLIIQGDNGGSGLPFEDVHFDLPMVTNKKVSLIRMSLVIAEDVVTPLGEVYSGYVVLRTATPLQMFGQNNIAVSNLTGSIGVPTLVGNAMPFATTAQDFVSEDGIVLPNRGSTRFIASVRVNSPGGVIVSWGFIVRFEFRIK